LIPTVAIKKSVSDHVITTLSIRLQQFLNQLLFHETKRLGNDMISAKTVIQRMAELTKQSEQNIQNKMERLNHRAMPLVNRRWLFHHVRGTPTTKNAFSLIQRISDYYALELLKHI
jgi:hypothetical protein